MKKNKDKVTTFIAQTKNMSTFYLYLQLGFQHISDFRAYDHILFLCALSAVYEYKQWLQILVLVTAFTIGHTLTLALATLNLIVISTDLIEFLIPVTILITAVLNIISKSDNNHKFIAQIKYGTALFFGLIHGLGFSNYLRSLLGTESSIIKPLFAFNIGLELGQILIVLLILTMAFLAINVVKVKKREWNLVISGASIGVSLIILIERAAILFSI